MILARVPAVTPETVALADAVGRVLAAPLVATHDQPPFNASAMDGYAMRAADVTEGAKLRVIGTSQAGAGFAGVVSAGEAVRIFTGAPLPPGATPEQFQKGVAVSLMIQRILFTYLGPVVAVVMLSIQAGLLMAISSVMGVKTTFRSLFNLVAGCALISMLEQIAVIVILKGKGDISSVAELRPPLGLGDACESSEDCTAEAGYCEIVQSHTCQVSDCSLDADDCFIGSSCCDLTDFGLPRLCVPTGTCPT